jgi:mRNA interferase RelE/StbE
VYRIRILERAANELARLDKPVRNRIIDRINWLAANVDATRLETLSADLAGLCKLRVGDYRVIYEVLHDEQVVLIHLVGHRRDIYRKR